MCQQIDIKIQEIKYYEKYDQNSRVVIKTLTDT